VRQFLSVSISYDCLSFVLLPPLSLLTYSNQNYYFYPCKLSKKQTYEFFGDFFKNFSGRLFIRQWDIMRDCCVLRPLLVLQPQFLRPVCTATGACFTTAILKTALYFDRWVFCDRSFEKRCVLRPVGVLRPQF